MMMIFFYILFLFLQFNYKRLIISIYIFKNIGYNLKKKQNFIVQLKKNFLYYIIYFFKSFLSEKFFNIINNLQNLIGWFKII